MDVKSEITGVVRKLEVSPGAQVAEGDDLMILESMKMEIPVPAPVAGRVRSIAVSEGDSVEEDQVLAVLDPS